MKGNHGRIRYHFNDGGKVSTSLQMAPPEVQELVLGFVEGKVSLDQLKQALKRLGLSPDQVETVVHAIMVERNNKPESTNIVDKMQQDAGVPPISSVPNTGTPPHMLARTDRAVPPMPTALKRK